MLDLKIFDRLKNRPDSEHEQALVRLALLSVFGLWFAYFYFYIQPLAAVAYTFKIIGYFAVISIALFVAIVIWPKASPFRRIFGIGLDFSGLFYAMYMLDEQGVFLFVVYLWVTIGNGLRYGQTYLLCATLTSVFSFGLLMVFSPYWQSHLTTAAGLLISFIALPIYFAVLIRRLDKKNFELKHLYDEMAAIATHDGLTGLPNRNYFHDQIKQLILSAERYRRTFAILYVDLDGFKEVNDAFGHGTGDKLIHLVAERLHECGRKSDIVARVGGDEFIMFLDEDRLEGAEHVAKKIINELARPFAIAAENIRISVSIGVALYPDDGDNVENLIAAADNAMYQAKRNGKNCYVFYRDTLNQTSVDKSVTQGKKPAF